MRTIQGSFINVGERTNVSGSARFRTLIQEEDYVSALEIARDQVMGGAMILDVNLDDGLIDGVAAMRRYLRLIAAEPDIAAIPIMIDSSRFEIIRAGLENVAGKPVVNSISLKEGEEAFLEQARQVMEFGAAVVIMAFDEKGQAESAEDKIRICSRAHDLLRDRLDFRSENIIFDPNVFAVATGLAEHNHLALAYFEACRALRRLFPNSHISGGVSNVSFALRGKNFIREAMHSVFLYHGMRHGMTMAIVNAGRLPLYSEIDAKLRTLIEDVYFMRSAQAGEALLEYAMSHGQGQTRKKTQLDTTWRKKDVEGRLSHALIHGLGSHIDEDIKEAHHQLGTAIKVIEGPLMAGMNTVGDLFGRGEMFLPQVVKSARIMKQAVTILTPWLEQEKGADGEVRNKGRILLATVKGDVHDIGKNIVGVVLRCNGFEVIDLGVMVPSARILEYAGVKGVDVIGLSGLITPSLQEMANVAEDLQRQGYTQPLLIGGATTSRLHTAIKIAPKYEHGVVHVLDAARAPQVATRLIDRNTRKPYLDDIATQYRDLRKKQETKSNTLASYEAACANRQNVSFRTYTPSKPHQLGVQVLRDYPLLPLIEYIDWQPFFRAWEFKGRYPALLERGNEANAAKRLMRDAQAMLKTATAERWFRPSAIFGLWPAVAEKEVVEVYQDEARKQPLGQLCFLRQQMVRNDERPNLSLVDYIATKKTGLADYIGAFAVTAGSEIDEKAATFKADGDDYKSILLLSLGDRIVEALAEHLHQRVRCEFWGYAPDENLDNEALIKERYQGIRPAHGYPACTDHFEKSKIATWLTCEETVGIRLTESYALWPAASIMGLYFAHPLSRYFGLGKIGEDQLSAMAAMQDRPIEDVRRTIFGTKT